MANAMATAIAKNDPKNKATVTRKHKMNATPAVMNQPPMTDSTPVMRNTALSRPHARSASDVPIATMKVT